MDASAHSYRFDFLSHSEGLCNWARRHLSFESGCRIEFRVVPWGQEAEAARKSLEGGAEAILCYGGIAQTLSGALPHSLAVIERTDMDFIRALTQLKAVSPKAAVCSGYREERDFATMQQILGMDLFHIKWATWEEMEDKINEAFAKGYRQLLGGVVGCGYMRFLGGHAMVLQPSPSSFRSALAIARSIARQKWDERTRGMHLMNIFNELDAGILCVDSKGQTVLANPRAASFKENRRDGLPAVDALCLSQVLSRGKAVKDRLVRHKGRDIMVSAYPVALHATEKGAVALFREVSSIRSMGRKVNAALYRDGLKAAHVAEDFVGSSIAAREVRAMLARFAATEAPVHIYGETGTGKELAAQAIHRSSIRATGPFVAVNCAALPESLLESELFGYEEGAFTGARQGGRTGLFELADGGSIFLDELAGISPLLQARLLRVLETRQVMRVGSEKIRSVDVRVISAANQPLEAMVNGGQFRPDLYYRLVVLRLDLPPLRQRADDLAELVRFHLRSLGKSSSLISPAMLRAMTRHSWPGNVRELFGLLTSYCLLLDGEAPQQALFARLLAERQRIRIGNTPEVPATDLRETRRRKVEEAVDRHGGNRHAAARELGISYNSVWRMLGKKPSKMQAGPSKKSG